MLPKKDFFPSASALRLTWMSLVSAQISSSLSRLLRCSKLSLATAPILQLTTQPK
ncbi:hypothetical protein K493DRAFT_320956 [Basidiobolus meristosporus CBS 931.73]|uniref:Uncharacterized protein n=1 Tax=Basidiobolus meristosporus CBS 931.73 TaxID=1314790 RepID=A0A1Y1X307_9FUNG|nr:hypothetical protein K493DRAFT_320956 [Basidiobolus meristosporus CBS 931.73]|eukprot:ORX80045.1 hypothetical protein K493DRAFT_320956 [Basidiobolus meristosporus CBS 931.73]